MGERQMFFSMNFHPGDRVFAPPVLVFHFYGKRLFSRMACYPPSPSGIQHHIFGERYSTKLCRPGGSTPLLLFVCCSRFFLWYCFFFFFYGVCAAVVHCIVLVVNSKEIIRGG